MEMFPEARTIEQEGWDLARRLLNEHKRKTIEIARPLWEGSVLTPDAIHRIVEVPLR